MFAKAFVEAPVDSSYSDWSLSLIYSIIVSLLYFLDFFKIKKVTFNLVKLWKSVKAGPNR